MSGLVQQVTHDAACDHLPTCVVVSDVLLYRDGLASGLGRLGGVEIAAAVSSHEMAETVETAQPDIVVLDISRREALAALRPLLHQHPRLPVVGFGINGQSDALRCAESGISCFVGRDESIEELNEAVEKALQGEAVCSPTLTARLIRHMATLVDNARVQTDNCLTLREREVAKLVKLGMSNKEIALELGISPATVKNHVHMILEKLNMPRRTSIGMVI